VSGDPARVRRQLVQRVRQVLRGSNGYGGSARQVVQVAVPIEGFDPFHWLYAQPGVARGYWSSRGARDGAVAMSGEADVCFREAGAGAGALKDDLQPRLNGVDRSVRYYGGMRFDAAAPAEEAWAGFGAYRFVLPRFELRRRGADARLLCNLVLPRDRKTPERILKDIEALPWEPGPVSAGLPVPIFREDEPEEEGWRRAIRAALDLFTRTRLSKVVLARRSTFGFAENVDPILLLKLLKAATPNRFHFCFQPAEGAAFLGASPERLFKQQERQMWSEAVAGTRPRGATATADARLRDELLLSEKEQREHEYVRQSIKEILSTLCETHHIDTTASEMRLVQGRHLVSASHGTLRPEVTTLDLLSELHPTPAVGGYPRHDARAAIASLEDFDRGWYAGPVGWVGPEAAEFTVAIRSGLLFQKSLSLYSGAGIVRGSTPGEEWDEIEQKIIDFIKVFGLDLRRAK
jgi:menaquinone-specific isochorismate synthase